MYIHLLSLLLNIMNIIKNHRVHIYPALVEIRTTDPDVSLAQRYYATLLLNQASHLVVPKYKVCCFMYSKQKEGNNI